MKPLRLAGAYDGLTELVAVGFSPFSFYSIYFILCIRSSFEDRRTNELPAYVAIHLLDGFSRLFGNQMEFLLLVFDCAMAS